MSKNIDQIFIANPITSNTSTDLMYFGQSPYGAGNDAAMTYANFSAQFGAPYTAAALTKTDDTNVTLTLGGTPATALLHAASLTLGWTGQLSLTRGGSNASLTASNGGIVYSTASAMAILAGTATANLPLLSGSTAAPLWGSFALSLGGALTTAGALTTVGAFGVTFTFTNTTSVTFPTSGTLATTSQIPTGAALTEVDDTNVTLTLGGSPSTALVNAASITAGWTGTLSGTRGGTGVNNGASTMTYGGNVAFSGAFTFTGIITANTNVTFPTSGTLATTTQLPTPAALTETNDTNVTLTLGGTPATALLQATSITAGWTGQLAVGRGGTGAATFNTNGVVISNTTTTGALASLSLTDGQIVIGSSAGAPLAASISAGTGISVTPGHNTISIAATGSAGITNVNQNTSSATLAANSRYATNNGASLVTYTLPASPAIGDTYIIVGGSSGGWAVAQNASQQINFGNKASTSGVGGSLASSNQFDCITITNVATNVFTAYESQGNITVV